VAFVTDDVRYYPATARVVVDVQNEFTDPAGSLSVPGAETSAMPTWIAAASPDGDG
jgi:nicotinamidase-related amidase